VILKNQKYKVNIYNTSPSPKLVDNIGLKYIKKFPKSMQQFMWKLNVWSIHEKTLLFLTGTFVSDLTFIKIPRIS